MTFRLSNINHVNFTQGMHYSEFLEQFQNYAQQLLCLVDNQLHFYDKKDHIPKNVTYVSHHNNQYHFKDDQKHYTVFGIEAAKLFCPSYQIKEIKEEPKREIKPIIVEYISKEDLNLIIYQQGHEYQFPRSNKILEIKKGKVFNT